MLECIDRPISPIFQNFTKNIYFYSFENVLQNISIFSLLNSPFKMKTDKVATKSK